MTLLRSPKTVMVVVIFVSSFFIYDQTAHLLIPLLHNHQKNNYSEAMISRQRADATAAADATFRERSPPTNYPTSNKKAESPPPIIPPRLTATTQRPTSSPTRIATISSPTRSNTKNSESLESQNYNLPPPPPQQEPVVDPSPRIMTREELLDAKAQLARLDQMMNSSSSAPSIAAPPRLLAQSHGFTLDQEGTMASVAVINAFSIQHYKNALCMFRTLIDVQYQGPLVIYLMRKPNEQLSPQFSAFIETMTNATSQLQNIQIFELEEPESFFTYCFKPRVIKHFLSLYLDKIDTLVWADSSLGFHEDPTIFASRLMQDAIGLSATRGKLGMYENTHPDTYQYLKINRTKHIDKVELQAGLWTMNLKIPGVVSDVLLPWIQCAVLACRVCMAPPNTQRIKPKGAVVIGPGGTKFLVHRQDQSVLSLLEYEYMDKNGTIAIDEKKYLNVTVYRRKGHDMTVTLEDLSSQRNSVDN